MTDEHVTKMIELLREKQVLILKAGTGTGKSTFAPYRLMDPPPESLQDVPPDPPFAKLTDLGPIIVTEPRVQAAVGVASFVGGIMSGAGGVGPGYPGRLPGLRRPQPRRGMRADLRHRRHDDQLAARGAAEPDRDRDRR